MKFENVFSFVTSLSVALAMTCMVSDTNRHHGAGIANSETPKFVPLPELVCKIDTIYVTDEFYSIYKNNIYMAGKFDAMKNELHFNYLCPAGDDKKLKMWCKINEDLFYAVKRHETEHARKALMTKNTNCYTPYVRAKIATMNEIMAPASEIIEISDNAQSYGRRIPKFRSAELAADSILKIHYSSLYPWEEIDFSNPDIADIVLNFGLNKFLKDFKRGVYKNTIRKNLDGRKLLPYTPNTESNFIESLSFLPQSDKWGPLFTYDTNKGCRVDIWNSAHSKTRERVLNTVDSVISTVMRPGDMLRIYNQSKNR